ncbi:MAG: hypothetical protein KDC45_02730, partial [Bacteroidetes bacterium]|nr:hypothetical protein [Bacteroidota bacterium]
MEFKSINPHDGREIGSHRGHNESEVFAKIESAKTAFASW